MNQVPHYWKRKLRKLLSESLASGRLDDVTAAVVADFLVTGAFNYLEVFGGIDAFSKEVRWAMHVLTFLSMTEMSASICFYNLQGYLKNEP